MNNNVDFKIRTDLAVEIKDVSDKVRKKEGFNVNEEYSENRRIKVTTVEIEDKEAEERMGKPIGKYITIEAVELSVADEGYHREISEKIAQYIKKLIPTKKKTKILVVGLGNREATPDSLGPKVIDNICITRKMTDEYTEPDMIKMCKNYEVSGIVPGVMAQTGMESAEIIKGIVKEIKPHVVIAIDSLAARSTKRLAATVQISDTGINPGSGVGNHRMGLTKETIGIPVIAIGIPTVVDAASIVNDTFDNLLDIFKLSRNMEGFTKVIRDFSPEEKYQLIKEILEPGIGTMYVTPKDIDETVKHISYTVSEALNILFSGSI